MVEITVRANNVMGIMRELRLRRRGGWGGAEAAACKSMTGMGSLPWPLSLDMVVRREVTAWHDKVKK
jgi:hypothetical protein